MSEYIRPPRKTKVIEATNTLFTDSFVEDYSVTVGKPVLDTYELLGLVPEAGDHTHSGASVSLGERAVALANIMATFNQLNKTKGARTITHTANNRFEARYSEKGEDPSAVIENMGRRAAIMIHHNELDYDVLNANQAMIAAGFNEKYVERQKNDLKKELVNVYGPGKAYVQHRSKVIRKAQVATKRVANAVKNSSK